METNYNDLRLVELRALLKKRGLPGYHRLEKAELIALLRNTSEERRDEPTPSVSVNPRPRSVARPPKATRPPLPPLESSLIPYELE